MDALNNDKIGSSYKEAVRSAAQTGKQVATQTTEAMGQQMQAVTETARGVSAEMLRYAGSRLQAHAENLQSLSRCQTPQSVVEQQMAFMRSSAEQFSHGVASLMQAAQGTGQKQAP